jgi:hydroxymethylbilane synthase
MKRIIRVGSRDSALAINQAQLVIGAIRRSRPDFRIDLVTMKTSGDLNLRPFSELNTEGFTKQPKELFTKELEQALLDGRIDLAVHSLKDMPMTTGFSPVPILAFFGRGDPRDALVLPDEKNGKDQAGAFPRFSGVAGCSSARRRLQLEKLMPGCHVRPIRGNVLTRLKKLDESGEYSFLILAAAGLRRLGMESRISRLFEPDDLIPAAGQGILACQGLDGEDYSFLGAVNDPDSEDCAKAERTFAGRLGGGCVLPVGAYAEVRGTELRLAGFYADEAKKIYRKGFLSGERKNAIELGEILAARLRQGDEGFER